MGRFALLASLLLTACATYTADYRERLVQTLPDGRKVAFDNTASYPGRVLCGEYTANRPGRYSRETRAFVVTPELTLNNPDDDERAVFCSKDPAASLLAVHGIGGADVDRATLAKITRDMAAIDAAVLAFYTANNYAPRDLAQLLDGDFGVSEADLRDPWGRAYRFSTGLAGRSLPRFTLSTLGRDGAEGGTGPDADIDNDAIDAVRHVLAISAS